VCACSFVTIYIHQVLLDKFTIQYTIQNTEIQNIILRKKALMECVETTILIDNNNKKKSGLKILIFFFHFFFSS